VIVVDIAFATAEADPAEQLAAWRDLVNRVSARAYAMDPRQAADCLTIVGDDVPGR
jgi:hypothetical protein